MFRDMRRKRQMLSNEEIKKVLLKGTSGVLAVFGDGGYPYAVPLSYVYDGKKIVFHCAKSGHKLDALKNNCKVSFCIIDQDDIVSHEFTTYFKSVIVFGKAHIIEDEDRKKEALEQLGKHYSPHDTGLDIEIKKQIHLLIMVEIEIDHITGKQAIELVNSNKSSEK